MKQMIHLDGAEITEAARIFLYQRGFSLTAAVLMDAAGNTGTLDGVTLVCSVEPAKDDRVGG